MSIKFNHRLGTIEADTTVYNGVGITSNTNYTIITSVSDTAVVANANSTVDFYYNGTITARAGGIGGIGCFEITEGDVAGDAGARILYFSDSGDAIKARINSGPNSGDLDIINNVSNKDINLTPSGTGNIALGNFVFDADQTVGAGQDNYVFTYDNATGLISLEAAAGGGITGTVANDQVVVGTGASTVDSSGLLTFDGSTLTAGSNLRIAGTTQTLELTDAAEIHFRDTVGTTEGIHLSNIGSTTDNPILALTSTALNPDLHLKDACELRIFDGGNTDYVAMSHDGTDFLMAGTGTADVRLTSANLVLGEDATQPWVTADSNNAGSNTWDDQGAGISVGESGKKGSAAIHITYNGDGSGYLGMGTVDDTTTTGGRPAFGHFDFTYNTYDVKVGGRLFPGTNSNTVQGTKYIEATTGYGSINVAGGGTGSNAGYSINNDVAFMSNGTTHGLYNEGALEWIIFEILDDSYVEMRYNNGTAIRTQNGATDGNSTWAVIEHNDSSVYDIGMNQMPQFHTNTNLTLDHSDCGGFWYSNNATTYTITLNNTAGQGASFPTGGLLFILNYGTGNCTINTGTGTLYNPQLGVGTTGSRTVNGNSVATILKYGADSWFVWGTNVT